MKNSVILLLCCGFLFMGNIFPDKPYLKTTLSQEEKKLYDMIMAYRKSKKLPPIPLSISLSYVAQTHVKDLMENFNINGNCSMHSWSKNEKWKDCCYTPDHKESLCMWEKPKELTSYPSEGFEVAHFYSRGAKAKDALEGWQSSKAHNPVLINEGIWKAEPWKAIGIGIYKNYACVWFGKSTDPDGKPLMCK